MNLFMKGQLNDVKELRILGRQDVLLNQGQVKKCCSSTIVNLGVTIFT
jgi:hypothetical protein